MNFFRDRLNLFFLLLLLSAAAAFLNWGTGYILPGSWLLFVLATLFGLFMAFNIGGNDVANAFGTSVGAGTLSIRQALVVAAIFEVSGAMLAGGEVTNTIRSGIVNLDDLMAMPHFNPMDFVYLMMAALLASAVWLLIATKNGWPVSTTHSIVGGIVGSSVMLGILCLGVANAFALVQWNQIGTIALSWILSPVLGGLAAFALFFFIRKFILQYNEMAEQRLRTIRLRRIELRHGHKEAFERMAELQQIAYTQAMSRDAAGALTGDSLTEEDFESDYYREMYRLEKERDDIRSHHALEFHVPMLAALGSMVISAMVIFKGLKHVALNLTQLQSLLIILMIAATVWMVLYIFARSQKEKSLERSTFLLFSWMQVFTAAGFAFSHGSNDIANAIGPFAAVLDVLHSDTISTTAPVPPIAMLAFGIAMCAGLWFIGREVIATIGTNLTKMHPASGFSAELSAAAVVMLASGLGIPVSSTHILVGAVLGIGIANHAANWSLMKPIALAWVITLPASALLSAGAFLLLRWIF